MLPWNSVLVLTILVRSVRPNIAAATNTRRNLVIVHCYHCQSSRKIVSDKMTFIKRDDYDPPTVCLPVPVRCHDDARSCVYGKVKVGTRVEYLLSGCTDETVGQPTCSRGLIPANNQTLLADFCLCSHELCNDHEFQSSMHFDDDADADAEVDADADVDDHMDDNDPNTSDPDHHDGSSDHLPNGESSDQRLGAYLNVENSDDATFAPNNANRLMNTVFVPANRRASSGVDSSAAVTHLRTVSESTTGTIFIAWLIAVIVQFLL